MYKLDKYHEDRKNTDSYQRMKENYRKLEKDREKKIRDIENQLKKKRNKRDEQMEIIRAKHMAKKKKEDIEKAKVTKKGKERR